MGCVVGSSAMKTRWLSRTLGIRVGVFVKGVWATLPTLAIGSGVGVILWWRVEVVKGVDVFNARGSIVTLNGSMILYTTCLTINISPHGWPREV